MTTTLHFVAYSALLTWVMFLVAALLRCRGWTPEGLKLAFGNRDNLPQPSPLAGRAERAARNTLENFVLFAALAITAQVAAVSRDQVDLGATIFFWARVSYVPVYLAGITYVRTAVWAVSIVGLGMIFVALL